MNLSDPVLAELDRRIALAQVATRPVTCRDNRPGTISREMSLETLEGGVLFRSTSYGNMDVDARHFADAGTHRLAELIGMKTLYEVTDEPWVKKLIRGAILGGAE